MADIQEAAKTLVLQGGIVNTNMNSALEIIFDNIMRHTIHGHNNITNHYVEDGIAIQDTTTVDPLTITVQGWMADLVYKINPIYSTVMSWVVQTAKIPIIGGIVATELANPVIIVNAIYERVRNAVESILTLKDKFTGTSRQKATSGYSLPFITFDEDMKLGYQTAVLENLRVSRLPVDISLPRIGVFHNMYVEDYEWDQDKAYYQAKISITFKQIRTTQTILTRVSNDSVTHKEAEAPKS